MAQLKSTTVQGSLRVTDTTYTTDLNLSSVTASKIAKIDANKNLTSGDLAASEIPTLSITDKTSGTLTVGRGGTGATTFTSGALLIGNGTDAVGTRTIKNMTALGDLGWTAATTDIYIPTVNTLAYWNGKYNSSTSNLSYCNKGAFGDMAIKTKGNGFSDSSNTISVAYGTSANTAVQGNQIIFTLNGSTKNSGSSASFYAPTGGGTAGQVLISAGTSAPSWYGGLTLTGTAAASYVASFTGTTAATSKTTGAVKIAGGLGVSGDTWSTKYNGLTLTAASTGFTIAGGTTSKTLTVNNTYTLGAACAYSVDDATGNGALGTGTGLTTERSVYYGLVTVNGASQTRATGIYAPTSAGTTNQILVSSGSGAPTWKATANGAAYATGGNGALTFGTLPIAQGGTGTNATPNQYGIIYASSTTAYASTAAGTSEYLLQSNGTAAPDWIQATSAVSPNTIVKRTSNGSIGVGNLDIKNSYTNQDACMLYMDNINITRGTVPSTSYGQWIQARDVNATRLGDLSFVAQTNNVFQIRLMLCDQVSDTSVTHPSGIIIQKTVGNTNAENVTLDANTGRWRSLWCKAASGESQMGVESTGNSGNVFFYAQAGNGNVGVYTSKHSNLISYQYSGTLVVGDTSIGRLALNSDGSAVLYSQTNHHLNLLANGNLVLYNSSNTIKWQTNTASSTRLVKNDIAYLNMSELERFKRLRPISFTYKPELRFADTSKQYGLLVEDLIYVYPELVSMPEDYDPNKFDIRKGIDQPIPGIKYQQFIPILINVVQLQQQEIETLKRKITEITTQ